MDEDRVGHEFAELEPPPSLARLVEFLSHLCFDPGGLFAGQEMPRPLVGTTGLGALSFAASIQARSMGMVATPGEPLADLMAKQSLRTADIQEFTRWLARWSERHTVLVKMAPPETVYRLAEPPEPEVREVVVERTVEVEAPAREKPDYWAEKPAEPTGPRPPTKPTPEAAGARRALEEAGRGLAVSNVTMAVGLLGLLQGRSEQAALMAPQMGGMGLVAPFQPQVVGRSPWALGPPSPPMLWRRSDDLFDWPSDEEVARQGGFGEPSWSQPMAPGVPAPAGVMTQPWGQPSAAYTGVMPPGSLARRDLWTPSAPPFALLPSPIPLSLAMSPLLGQVTLLAPPLTVASRESEAHGSAVEFKWRDLAQGAGPLDAASLEMIQRMAPEGTRAIYPALPPESVREPAVNLRLAPSLLNDLLYVGYGPQAAQVAAEASSAAAGEVGVTHAQPMPGAIVPVGRPAGEAPSVLGPTKAEPAKTLAQAGAGQARRVEALEFLGLPVRLAPTLGGSPELRHEVELRQSLPATPMTTRPAEFGPLRRRLFPSFQTVTAEPDKTAWRQAAPRMGLRDARPLTILSPDARAKLPTATSALPQATGGMHGERQPIGPAPTLLQHESLGERPPLPPSPLPIPYPMHVPMAFPQPAIGLGPRWSVEPTILHPQPPPVVSLKPPAVPHPPTVPKLMDHHLRPAEHVPPQKPWMPTPVTHPVGRQPFVPTPEVHPVGPPHVPPSVAAPSLMIPALQRVVTDDRTPVATQHRTTVRTGPPQMLIAPPPAPKPTASGPPMAIQKSVDSPDAAGPAAREAQKGSSLISTEHGASASEVNLLANEVWSVLKRRLRFEAERMGRR